MKNILDMPRDICKHGEKGIQGAEKQWMEYGGRGVEAQ